MACTFKAPFKTAQLPKPKGLYGVPYAYDGDSIFFGYTEVRLAGIDAPELNQQCHNMQGALWPCGVASRNVLRRLINVREVHCEISGKDKYQRLLGTCFVGAENINAEMVRSGNAIAYLHFTDRYDKQQNQAKLEKVGIWQDAHFTEPYYCRHKMSGHKCYTL